MWISFISNFCINLIQNQLKLNIYFLDFWNYNHVNSITSIARSHPLLSICCCNIFHCHNTLVICVFLGHQRSIESSYKLAFECKFILFEWLTACSEILAKSGERASFNCSPRWAIFRNPRARRNVCPCHENILQINFPARTGSDK